MRLEYIKISELTDFVRSDLYQNLSNFPITIHRALSQHKNPRAGEDDVVLILALDDKDQLMGYIGALPDKIFCYRQPQKIAWNSCWWSNPESGKKAVMQLMAALFQSWNDDICFSDLGSHAREIIAYTNRYHIVDYHGFRLFFRTYFNQFFTSKYKILNAVIFSLILKALDGFLNRLTGIWRIILTPGENGLPEINSTIHLSDKAVQFIREFKALNISERGKEEMEWIINNPWVEVRNEVKKIYHGRYYFSHSAKTFNNYFLEVGHNNQLLSVLMFQERDGHYRLPYLFAKDENINLVTQVILHHLFAKKALSFISYHPLLVQNIIKRSGAIFKRKVVRYAAFPKKFGTISKEWIIQDGDGDAVFC